MPEKYEKVRDRQPFHLNNNQLACVRIHRTGDTPGFHDIIEICVLPVDSQFKPTKIAVPFYCGIQPKRPENIDYGNPDVPRSRVCELMQNAVDPYDLADRFELWFNQLNLNPGKKIAPIATDWTLISQFLIDWLGEVHFNSYFDSWHLRDPQIAANYCNDKADYFAESPPYPKTYLMYLRSQLEIEKPTKFDLLEECLVMAETWKRMLKGRF